MWRFARIAVSLLALVIPAAGAEAQRNCRKGKPCGNSCIAINRACRIGPASSTDSRKPQPVAPDESREAVQRALVERGTNGITTEKGTKVWLNTKSGVYHCPGSRYFGATSSGTYTTETAAQAAGNHPAYGRRCNQ
jgi:hypothetical protein